MKMDILKESTAEAKVSLETWEYSTHSEHNVIILMGPCGCMIQTYETMEEASDAFNDFVKE